MDFWFMEKQFHCFFFKVVNMKRLSFVFPDEWREDTWGILTGLSKSSWNNNYACSYSWMMGLIRLNLGYKILLSFLFFVGRKLWNGTDQDDR